MGGIDSVQLLGVKSRRSRAVQSVNYVGDVVGPLGVGERGLREFDVGE